MPRALLGLLAALTVLIPTACGGGGSGGETGTGSKPGACAIGALDGADEPVTVNVWNTFAARPKATLDRQIEAFNASQDQVRVVNQPQGSSPAELQAKVEAAAADRDLPGLVALEDVQTRWAVDSELFAPAQACIDAHADLKRTYGDLLPSVARRYQVEGELQPGAFYASTALLYLNRSHFEAAGLDPDEPPTTLRELYRAARAIKAAKPDVTPLVFSSQAWILEFLLTGARQAIVDEDNGASGLATASTLHNPAAVEVLELLGRMHDEGLADIIPASPGQVDHVLAMAQQQSSMLIESSAATSTVAGVIDGTLDAESLKADLGIDLPAGAENLQLDLDIDTAPLPGLDGAGRGQVAGVAWYVPGTNTPEVQAGAWAFVEYLNTAANQAQWATDGGALPVFRSAADDASVQKAWTSTLGGRWQATAYATLLDGVDPDFPGPVIGPYTETRAAIRKALDQALLDGEDPERVLTAADETVTEELARYRDDVGG